MEQGIKCNAHVRMGSHMEDGKWGTPEQALGSSAHADPAGAAVPSFHSTAQERQILSIAPEWGLFLPLIGRLDPGYRNVKRSTNMELALNPNDFFFPFPFIEGREKKKKSCMWLPFLDLQQIPLNFKNNALRCWRMQTGN